MSQNTCIDEKNILAADPVSKRKMTDTDIELVDIKGHQKRSYSGDGVFYVTRDPVAEIGVLIPTNNNKNLIWNGQRINNSFTVKALQDRCWRERPNMVFLKESMVDKGKLERMRNKCGFTEGLSLDSARNSWGIDLWWRDMNVTLVSFSTRHTLVDVREESDNPRSWYACEVYGWPDRPNKLRTWELIRRITDEVRGPLFFLGDFNEILINNEKEGGGM